MYPQNGFCHKLQPTRSHIAFADARKDAASLSEKAEFGLDAGSQPPALLRSRQQFLHCVRHSGKHIGLSIPEIIPSPNAAGLELYLTEQVQQLEVLFYLLSL